MSPRVCTALKLGRCVLAGMEAPSVQLVSLLALSLLSSQVSILAWKQLRNSNALFRPSKVSLLPTRLCFFLFSVLISLVDLPSWSFPLFPLQRQLPLILDA